MIYLINFSAFCLPLAVFTFWSLVGYASLVLLHSQRNIFQNILLAPSVGMAVTLLFLFWVNRFGIPVAHFAQILTIILLMISVVIFIRYKVKFPVKRYLPFMAVFVFALLMIGRPLFEYGFDWISYSNDDMAIYCLGALRFLQHGYTDLPDINKTLLGTDYSDFYGWSLYMTGMSRSGSELILAWVSAVTSLPPLNIFMPSILALYLCLISSICALIYTSRRHYYTALSLGLLICFSALISFGVVYQLIAQVDGLALLVCAVILSLQHMIMDRRFSIVKKSLLTAIIVAALLICYPEILPFLAISVLIYYGVNYYYGWRPDRIFGKVLLVSSLLVIVLLGSHFVFSLMFLISQFFSGMKATHPSNVLYPYFLIPKGMADLWGLQAEGGYSMPDPMNSITIIIGFCLSILATFASVWMIRQDKKFVPAYISSVMIILFIYLFFRRADYGLFKLAMYIQPFLLATLVLFIFTVINKTSYRALCLIAFALIGVNGQHYYLSGSSGEAGGGRTEIIHASSSKISKEFRNDLAMLPVNSTLLSTSFNIVLMRLQVADAVGKKIGFCSDPNFLGTAVANHYSPLRYIFPKLYLAKDEFIKKIQTELVRRSFSMHDVKDRALTNDFSEATLCNINSQSKNVFFAIDSKNRTVINKSKFNTTEKQNFIIESMRNVHDLLIFTNSSLGPVYYSLRGDNKSKITLYNTESDWFYPHSIMQGIGRYLLFRVINPSEKIRLKVNVTTTFTSDGNNLLPQSFVIGNNRVAIPFVGRGSARLFSESFSPQYVGGNAYLALDLGKNGTIPHYAKAALMKLYGNKIAIDLRRLVMFARDITLVSDDEYRHLSAPSELSNFPSDLANPDLEYSGLYEDGWMSDHAFLKLRQPANAAQFVLNGTLPKIYDNFHGTHIQIQFDDKKVYEKNIEAGDFTIKIPVLTSQACNKKIELFFSQLQKLPGDNPRPVTVLVHDIGFQQLSTSSYIDLTSPHRVVNFSNDLNNIKYAGWFKDGWLSGDSYILLHQLSSKANLVIKGMLPKYINTFNNARLTITLEGQIIYDKIMYPGSFTINLPVSSVEKGLKKIELHFDKTQQLPMGDSRIVAAHISYIGLNSVS